MKNFILTIMKYGMRCLYFFLKLLTPVRDRVVFISRQSDTPSVNFRMLEEEINRLAPQYTCEFYCKLGLKSEMGLSYVLLMLRQMKALAGARVCITESYCIPISLLSHKKELTVIQIWHSMVAIKQFGWQTVDKPEGSPADVARIMQMHSGYDYVIVGSEYMRGFFAEAMNTPKEKILPLGMPSADRILKNGSDTAAKAALREEFDAAYPEARGKKMVAYLPTMRRGTAVDCAELTERFDDERFTLVIKLHPLDKDTVIHSDRAITDRRFTTEQVILLADAVISDYSGAAAEAALLGKPVYFFVPDIESYSARCGMNVNPLEVFPKVSFTEAAPLAEAVCGERASHEDVALVHELLCGGCDGHSTENITKLALGIDRQRLI